MKEIRPYLSNIDSIHYSLRLPELINFKLLDDAILRFHRWSVDSFRYKPPSFLLQSKLAFILILNQYLLLR